MENKTKTIRDVFLISETGKEEIPNRWTKIGVAFENRDGSLNVILDAVPLSGRLQIRLREAKKQEN